MSNLVAIGNKCSERLDEVIELVEEMKSILADGEPDAPQAFMEAAFDVQDRINRVLQLALVPVLNLAKANAVK
ncbi:MULTISPECIES: hypothetical protein [unclassified Paraburkholderia]|uniref:hypothetical protein n=1 Tax=unclassified Paraburkholderia TaxID=2615204 RepID=UPI002AAFE222|nr:MULTISPECIES: hypothetical protein [unclassified Paraburkholderia]